MDNTGPILVKPAVPEDSPPEAAIVSITTSITPQGPLNLALPTEVLSAISENTGLLHDKLNTFINCLNSKIQSV